MLSDWGGRSSMCMKIYRARAKIVEKELGPVLLQRWLSASHALHINSISKIPEVSWSIKPGGFNDHNSQIPHWGKVKDATDRLLRVDLKKETSGESVLESDQDQLLQVLTICLKKETCWFIGHICSTSVRYCMFLQRLAPSCASWWSTLSGLNHLIATWQRQRTCQKHSFYLKITKTCPSARNLDQGLLSVY